MIPAGVTLKFPAEPFNRFLADGNKKNLAINIP
jgi:hypothetical protein